MESARRAGRLLVILFLCLGAQEAWSAEGLPEDCPDLYDEAALTEFQSKTVRPFVLFQDAPAMASTVLTSSLGYIESDTGTRAPLLFIIGFLKEPKQHRIVAITQTFLHADDGTRSLRAWVDRGYVNDGYATGEWNSMTEGGITAPMSVAEAAKIIKSIVTKVGEGQQKSLLRVKQ